LNACASCESCRRQAQEVFVDAFRSSVLDPLVPAGKWQLDNPVDVALLATTVAPAGATVRIGMLV
jgi:hypothetical protein